MNAPVLHLHHDGLSRPLEASAIRLRVLSLGAGVQSTTLALMAARGEIEAPDCAIFADTQSEPASVYRHLAWLATQLPFPIYTVTDGSLRDQIISGVRVDGRPPLFVRNAKTGAGGFTRRQCTQHFKIIPIGRKVRELIGLKKGSRGPKSPVVEQWIGISTDEIQRLKDSRFSYIHMRHPLIEARMSRRDCLAWLAERQYPTPPKSACSFCPYHTNEMWRDLRDNDPEAWGEALAVDDALERGIKGLTSRGYLHRSMMPLALAPIDQPDVHGFDFNNECEGMCGV